MYLVSALMAVVEISNQCGVEVCMHFFGACIVVFPSDCSLCGVPESVLISPFEFMQRNMHCEKVSICLVYQTRMNTLVYSKVPRRVGGMWGVVKSCFCFSSNVAFLP